MNKGKGFYIDAISDTSLIQLGASIGYDRDLKDFYIWIKLFVVDIYIGFRK